MPNKEVKTIYTIGEAAKFLNKSIQTLRRWVRDGKIECIRTMGGFRRFSLEELERVKQFGPIESKSPVITAKEASEETGVSKQTIKRRGKKGKITLLKSPSNRILFPKKEIEEKKQQHFLDIFSHTIFPHEFLHVGVIIISIVVFVL